MSFQAVSMKYLSVPTLLPYSILLLDITETALPEPSKLSHLWPVSATREH